MSTAHVQPVQIYYEDTDFSGVVYHANYLRYFERGREHMLGVDELTTLWDEQGLGFVVYKAELTYREGAKHGDACEVRSTVEARSTHRAVFYQSAYRLRDEKLLVEGVLHLCCVDADKKLVRLPGFVADIAAKYPHESELK